MISTYTLSAEDDLIELCLDRHIRLSDLLELNDMDLSIPTIHICPRRYLKSNRKELSHQTGSKISLEDYIKLKTIVSYHPLFSKKIYAETDIDLKEMLHLAGKALISELYPRAKKIEFNDEYVILCCYGDYVSSVKMYLLCEKEISDLCKLAECSMETSDYEESLVILYYLVCAREEQAKHAKMIKSLKEKIIEYDNIPENLVDRIFKEYQSPTCIYDDDEEEYSLDD